MKQTPRTPEDFVRVATRDIERGNICILYAVAYDTRTAARDKIWSEMHDPAFRNAVAALLPAGRFLPPDELDDWTFVLDRPVKRHEH